METTEYRLGDVCKLRNGYAFKSENFTNEGVPVIRISNINDNEATVNKALKTNPSSVFDKFAVKKGDILIAMSGATTGKFGIYNSEQKAYQNQRVGCFVITDEEKLSNDYLYLLLNGLKRKIETDAYGGGQPNISSTIIENYKINLPSLTEQEKIVGVLNQADALVRQRKRTIELQDEFLKTLFLKMFGDPFTNEKKWAYGKFKELATIERTQVSPSEFTNEDFYIGLEDIEKVTGNIIKTSLENAEELKSSKFRFTNEHILYAKLRPYLNKVALPNTGGICSTDIFPILPIKNISQRYFICYLMRSKYFVNEMTAKSVGANLPRANPDAIQNLKVYKPPIELQNQFSEIVEKSLEIKIEYQASLGKLEKLLGSLTQRAFRGDLNIVERIEISGYIKIQPKISAEVIAIDNMNKQLADFHNSIANIGAPIEIVNKLKQLDAELKLRGEIPFWDEYVKYRLIKEKQTTPFTFEKLWKEITEFPFASVPEYDTVKKMIFKLLNSDNPFLKQRFNESDKQIELLLNETTSA